MNSQQIITPELENETDFRHVEIPMTVAEYFAGIGLVRLAFEREGWQVLFANDNNLQKLEMYQAYFKDAGQHYNTKNVFDLSLDDVPVTTLATASFPCIDLSLAGNMNGIVDGEHSSAFWGFQHMLQKQAEQGIAPPLVMLENVPGWLYSNKGADFRLTVKSLNDIGYYCDVIVLDALRFTPQSRERVFLIGTRHPTGQANSQPILNRTKSLSSVGLIEAIKNNPDLLWNYVDLPEPPSLRSNGLTSEIIEVLPDDDPRWWPAKQVERHFGMMADLHRKRVDALRNGLEISYRTFYRRSRKGQQRAEVRNDDIAGCLRTAVGGSSRQFIVAAGRGQIKMRIMTPREYARLQGVPDDYPINVEENQAMTGFGDAVCVPAVSWVAKHALDKLRDNVAFIKPLLGPFKDNSWHKHKKPVGHMDRLF